MSRVCQLSGKRPRVGRNVSHSQKRTQRWFYPNIQKRRIFVPELGRYITLRVSTKALRTIDKKGLLAYAIEQGLRLSDLK